MFSAATAPEVLPVRRARRQPRRPLVRRDPRRFARGMVRFDALPQSGKTADTGMRFFAHSFAGAFLFVSLLIA